MTFEQQLAKRLLKYHVNSYGDSIFSINVDDNKVCKSFLKNYKKYHYVYLNGIEFETLVELDMKLTLLGY